MTVVQTLLVFVGIPLLTTLIIFLATFGGSLVRQPNRYRPGKAWTYGPQWFVPHPEAVVHDASQRQIEAGSSSTTAVGGASGEW